MRQLDKKTDRQKKERQRDKKNYDDKEKVKKTGNDIKTF